MSQEGLLVTSPPSLLPGSGEPLTCAKPFHSFRELRRCHFELVVVAAALRAVSGDMRGQGARWSHHSRASTWMRCDLHGH